MARHCSRFIRRSFKDEGRLEAPQSTKGRIGWDPRNGSSVGCYHAALESVLNSDIPTTDKYVQ